MTRKGKATPEKIARAKELYDGGGLSFKAIARAIGVASGDTIKRWLDPKWAERSRQYQRDTYQRVEDVHLVPLDRGPDERDLKARWREIPPDTRDLTARLCGDPLPGRRALDRRA